MMILFLRFIVDRPEWLFSIGREFNSIFTHPSIPSREGTFITSCNPYALNSLFVVVDETIR